MNKLTEEEIGRQDVKAIFNIASDLRKQPQGSWGKLFGKKAKDKIDISDLQQAWQQAGYPDTVRDIKTLLGEFGFDKKEINKVLASAFGETDDEYDAPVASQAILKIAEYAKKAGIDKDLIMFMQKEYGFKESYNDKKAMIEDVRYIFTAIIQEERAALPTLVKHAEKSQLGRNRK